MRQLNELDGLNTACGEWCLSQFIDPTMDELEENFRKIGPKQNYFEDGHEQKFLNQITDFTQ